MGWFTLDLATPIWLPRDRGKKRMTSSPNHVLYNPVHFLSICYVILVLFCGFFRYFWRFGVFFELVFHSDCIRQKRKCRLEWDFLAGGNQITSSPFDRSWSLVSSGFDSGPCVASLVRMRHDVLLLHDWDNDYLFCSRTRLSIALALNSNVTADLFLFISGNKNCCQSHGVCPGV